MFRDIVTETCLTSQKADMFFGNSIVQTRNYDGDVSLLSTVRALLYDRIDLKNERFFVDYMSFQSPRDKKDICIHVANAMQTLENGICICNFNGCNSRGEISFEDQDYLAYGYHKLNVVTELFRKKYSVHAFINESTKSVLVITFNMDARQYHFIQCAIMGMMPWWFNTSDIDDDKKELLYSLQKNTKEEYLAAISNIAKKLDFRTEYIKNSLAGFEKYHEKQRERDLTTRIRETNDQILVWSERISNALVNIRQFETELIGIKTKLKSDSEESEMMNYFLANKHLDLRAADEGMIEFVAYDYLSYFNEDQAEKYIKNKNSYFYEELGGISADDMEKVLTAIFIDKSMKIKMCAAYRLNVERMNISARHNYPFGPDYRYMLPNPHIDQYECIGDYRQIFNQCMESRNYIQAIEQAVASAKSLNLSDVTVMCKLMRQLLGYDAVSTDFGNKCIELPDGKMVDIRGAIQWIYEQEGVKNEQID